MIAITATLGAAVAALAYAALCAAVAHRFTRARRVAPCADQRAELDAHAVRFAARDGRARIEGWYLEAKPRRGAVIFVHGKDACRGDELKSPTLHLARALNAHGLSVLMLDLRGHGLSSGARLTYGEHERHDVLGAVDYLLERGHMPGRIGVLGASMGAATALLAAVGEPAVGAVVVDSAFADFGQMIERQFHKLSHGLPRFVLPGALAIARMMTGVALRRVRPLDAAASLRGRSALVIHSEGDRFVPPIDGMAISQAIGAELWCTASAGHIGSYRHAPAEYTARISRFFAAELNEKHEASSIPSRGDPSLTDDVRLHRTEHAEDLVLLSGRHLELVERLHEVFDQRVELGVGDVHAAVRSLHVDAGVPARAAGAGADLLHQHPLQVRDVGIREALVDACIGRDIADEVVDDRDDCGLAAEAFVKAAVVVG